MIISLIAEQPLITYTFFNQKKRSETSSFLLFWKESRDMIKELIVVEGKSDTVAVKRAVEADTIETGGRL